MANTTNFNWATPDDTDLVKDGAAAIRTLGSSIDTSLVDLKGGTTGQILSKASNADMDFTFITPNVGDITEVQAGVGISIASGTGPIPVITNSSTDLITTAGDLLYGTAADTVARLGIGTAGQVLKVNSGATAPEWGAASSGALTKIASGSYSAAATTNVDSVFSSTYTKYLVILQWTTSVGNANLQWQYRYSGSTENSAQYYGGAFRQDRNNTKSDYGFAGTTSATIDTNGGTANPSLAFIYVSDVGNSSQPAFGFASGFSSDNQGLFNAAHYVNVSRTYDGFALTADSGNLTGTYAVYGVTN